MSPTGVPQHRDEGQLGRGLLRELSVEFEHFGGLAGRPSDDSSDDLGADWMKQIIDSRDHSEVPAPSAKGPKEVIVIFSARPNQPAISGDDVHADRVVGGPAPAPSQVTKSSPQGETCDARERNEAKDRRKPMKLSLAIHIAQ